MVDASELVSAFLDWARSRIPSPTRSERFGFLPVSQLSSEHYPRVEEGDKNKILEVLKGYVGQLFKVQVITADAHEEKLIVSEKAVNEDEMRGRISKLGIGEIVEGELRDRLLGILFNQQYNDRLPRFLPENVAFAHKTGTIGGIRNDSGIIFVNPNNHVIVTAFTIWDEVAVRLDPHAHYQRVFEVETAMGKIGRLAYEHFLQLA